MKFNIFFLMLVIAFVTFSNGCIHRTTFMELGDHWRSPSAGNRIVNHQPSRYYSFGGGSHHSERRDYRDARFRYSPTQFERRGNYNNNGLVYSPTHFERKPVRIDEERFKKPFLR